MKPPTEPASGKPEVSLEEYRRSLLRRVKTSSGLVFHVKLLASALPFLKAARKHGLLEGERLDPLELAERTDRLLHEILSRQVVKPRIGVDLEWEEISDEDKLELFRTVVERLSFLRGRLGSLLNPSDSNPNATVSSQPTSRSLPKASQRNPSPAGLEAPPGLGSLQGEVKPAGASQPQRGDKA